MSRFFVPEEGIEGDRVVLTGGDARHAVRVLRVGPGDRLRVVLPDGSEAQVVVEWASPTRLAGRIVERRRPEREPRLRIRLAQALLKGDKFDWVVQKGTEVGVAAFLPFRSARSVARLDGDRARARVDRWRRIAREAAEQCGRLVVPEVAEVGDLQQVAAQVRAGCPALLAWEAEEGLGLYDALVELAGELRQGGREAELLLIVGPEGGFEQEEARGLIAAGARAVSLGRLIFRAETAGVAAAVMALYHVGDLGRAPARRSETP